jgi:acyl-CoA thioester hydrolase
MSENANVTIDLANAANFPFWSRDRIRFADLDLNGHVNNISFAVYIETGRVHFRESLTERSKPGHKIDFVVLKVTITYLRQGYYPGKVDIGTRVLKLGKSSCTLGHGIFCDGVCIGTGETIWVYTDTEKGKSQPMPDNMRELLSPYMRGRDD